VQASVTVLLGRVLQRYVEGGMGGVCRASCAATTDIYCELIAVYIASSMPCTWASSDTWDADHRKYELST
jgi:hypothetical protein